MDETGRVDRDLPTIRCCSRITLRHLHAAQPGVLVVARTGVLRGRDADGPVPAVPRREGQGRHRHDDDGRFGGGRRGQPAGVRQPARLRRRHRAVDPPDDRRGPRARGGVHDPADPPRPADRVGPGRLAARASRRRRCASRPTERYPKEAEDWDIDRIVGQYADAAERMQAGGMDGIEIECYGHLFDQFWSPLTNRRTDDYGGSLENRLRFALAVLGAIRERVGPGVPGRRPHGGRRDGARRHRRRHRARDPAPGWRPKD